MMASAPSSQSVGTVLIAGASGVVGLACLKHFEKLSGWRVVAAARRPMAHGPGVECLSLDLRDAAACHAALHGRTDITHVVYCAVMEQAGGLVSGWSDREQMQVNLGMLRNVVEPLDHMGSGLRHVTIMQGGKAYGIHLGEELAVPARERWPRHPHENFYWLQEDFLRERQAVSSGRWHYTIFRPRIVFGAALGSNMNPIAAIGVYAAICHAQGRPLAYPGGPPRVNQAVDADLIAQACAWAGSAITARNETFNLDNGEVFVWHNVWPAIADAMGMAVGPAHPQRLADVVPASAALWRAIVARHQLQAPADVMEFVGQSLAYTDFQMNTGREAPLTPVIMSSVKVRQAGFHACMDTEEMFCKWFRQLQDDRLLPGVEVR